MHINNRNEAETQVCAVIASLGRLAGIDVDLGEGPDDIDATLIQAAYESNFADPAFLGGPGCFEHADQPGVLVTLDTRAGRIARGLARYIATRGGSEAMRQAQAQLAMMDDTFAWLRQQHCGASA
jgi:hypothetical protein